MTLEEARALTGSLGALYGPGPEMAEVVEETIPTGDGHSFGVRLLKPTATPRAVIVYMHGGGWVVGDIDEFDTLGRQLAQRTGCAVAMVNYRLAPEHPYPAAIDDCWNALRWADQNMERLVGRRAPLIVAGDSAGGTLAAIVAQRSVAAGGPTIALQVLVYPVTDHDLSRPSYADPGNQLLLTRDAMAWFWDLYVPSAETRDRPDASPLRAASLAGGPPAVVLTAEYDVLRDEGEAYVAKLRAAGVPVVHKRFDRQMHGFFSMVNVLPGAKEGMEFVGEQIDRHLAQASRVDAVVVGAGFAGLYQLHLLREMGLRTRVIESGGDVGGTWYWNRYPGARCDVESMGYSYSFSPELEQEWTWTEKYPPQPEILKYIQHVADRFDLRRDITFNTNVTRAVYDEDDERWMVYTDGGEVVSAQYLIMATGCLSVSKTVEVPGEDRFQGQIYHTGEWPEDRVDFSGLKVGVIGTGSSGIQVIPMIAQEAAELTVFQRTPNFSLPARNRLLTDQEITDWKARYRQFRKDARSSFFGVPVERPTQSALEVSEEERRQKYEHAWQAGHLTAMLGSFNDILINRGSNDTAAEFIRDKIRSTVTDPDVAETLTPRTYPVGTERPCLDTDYYETFNRENVRLVDLRKTPMEEITARGIRTSAQEHELDAIVFATGYDAITGALMKVDIRGVGGEALRDKWAAGPRTYLGIAVSGFPNLFTITGPSSPSVLSNVIVSIEQHVEWVSDCIRWMREGDLAVIEAEEDAEDEWAAHTEKVASMTLYPEADSWYIGANVPGKPRVFMAYIGGIDVYRIICDQIAAAGYEGFSVRAGKEPARPSLVRSDAV
ncbi:MAG: alpha/beta hydrolase fold domain-containing protein [Caulobacterales bacterium]|nr:alpha/beta hydrolase fold domain-containing protein [Caulobacterales bacterium]